MTSMKNMEKTHTIFFPRLVSMETAAIFDFRALTKVHTTSKPLLQKCSEKLHTHRRHIKMKKRTEAFLLMLNINFF